MQQILASFFRKCTITYKTLRYNLNLNSRFVIQHTSVLPVYFNLPVLSAQLITAPTGKPNDILNLAPAEPPRPKINKTLLLQANATCTYPHLQNKPIDNLNEKSACIHYHKMEDLYAVMTTGWIISDLLTQKNFLTSFRHNE